MQAVRRFFVLVVGSIVCSMAPGSVQAQPRVLQRASSPVISRVATQDKVVFVTIDDGYTRTAGAAERLEQLGWPVTSFVLPKTLGPGKTSYFASLGSKAEFANHTVNHPSLAGRSFKQQKNEICGAGRRLDGLVGPHTTLFRPPYGSHDATTLRAAAACGMTHTVLWRVTVFGSRISTWGGPIRSGDIILLHYVKSLPRSLDVLATELRRLGLKPALLSQYLVQQS